MPQEAADKVAQEITERYLARTRLSREYDQQAREYLPGGDTRTATYYAPYPTYMAGGQACTIRDVDGNSYTDFHNNYTSLIHGHAFAAANEAAYREMRTGTVLGSPVTLQFQHAEILRSRVPSMERIRYTNSGTEATMFAIRAARAFTGKYALVKMDGAYHGTHDFVEVNVASDPDCDGAPVPRVTCKGVPPTVLNDTLVVPFNDLSALEATLKAHKKRIAAVIVEPMPGGAGDIPPLPGYLKGVRELTLRYGVLMIMDEVITFRLSTGGAQVMEGIRPDLTALGKIIGGGFAVGAFGGRKDIMALFDPGGSGGMSHSGTFNGNSVTMAAGIANLKAYDQKAVDHVNRLGGRMRKGFSEAFLEAGITGQMTGVGSMGTVHWCDGPIVNARDAAVGLKAAGELPKLAHLSMLNHGIFIPMRSQYAVSTPMVEALIDKAVEAFSDTLHILKPYVAETAPRLLK